jgi:hypothetical protein
MDIIALLTGVMSVIWGFLTLIFVPGFVLLLVFFPRFSEMGLIKRLIYSTVLGFVPLTAFLLVMNFVPGVTLTLRTVSLGLGIFSAVLLVVWLCEIWYLSSAPAEVRPQPPARVQGPRRYISRIRNSRRDRFTKTAMARVVWHENVPSGPHQIDHTFLIDVGDVIDILQVDEKIWKFSDTGLIRPPYPKTRNFELFIRELREDGSSMIDDLQIYPVQVSRKPGLTLLGHRIRSGALAITGRIYKKTDKAEIQWIYTHDFHLFAILYSQDTLDQMVDRVLVKLDEIALSIKKGSRVSSHIEDTQKLRDEFDIVIEKPRKVPTITEVPAKAPASSVFSRPIDGDRRKFQADIVRDLKVRQVTPATFRKSDNMIASIKIPDRTDLDKIRASIRELQDEDWLYT